MLSVTEVKKLLKQGLNDEQIGIILGCSKYKIHRFRKANNIPSSRSLSNENKIKQIKKLNGKCKNQKELGKKLNITQQGVSALVTRNKIEYSKKPSRLRIRKFGTWTIAGRNEDSYSCRCDCGFEKVFTHSEIKYNSNKCPQCKMNNPLRVRKKMFLADYKRAEKLKQKDLQKRGKNYIINNVKDISEIGIDTYVNLQCSNGHLTKNKFTKYDGCKVCKQA